MPFPPSRLSLRIRPPHIPCDLVLETIWLYGPRRRVFIFRKIHLYGKMGGRYRILLTTIQKVRTFRTFCGKPLQGNPHPSCPGAPTAGAPGPGVGSKGRSRGTRGTRGRGGTAYPAGCPETGPTRHATQTNPSTVEAHSGAPKGIRARSSVFWRSRRSRLQRAHRG